jgi:hypothetical protein
MDMENLGGVLIMLLLQARNLPTRNSSPIPSCAPRGTIRGCTGNFPDRKSKKFSWVPRTQEKNKNNEQAEPTE